MIFSTQNQLNCFILFIFCGFIAGIIFNVFSFLFLKKYQKIFQKIIFDGIFYAFFSIFYVFLINFFNFGKISLVLIFGYVMGFIWAIKVLSKLVVFFSDKCYNHFKSKRNLKNGRKTRKQQVKTK